MLGSKIKEQCGTRSIETIAPARAEADLASFQSLEKFFRQNDFQVLINCAGFTRVDDCEDPAGYKTSLALNANGVGSLARLCKETGRLLIHYSTDYVFDGENEAPYEETDDPRPLNAYGRTKWMGEKRVLEQNPPFYLIRTSWLYGPGGRNFVKTMAGLLKTRSRVEVVADQKGAPTYTGDLAAFTLDLLGKKAEKGLYHFSNAGETSWYGITLEIRDQLNLGGCEVDAITSDKFTRPAQRPLNSRFHLGKATRALGHAIRPWREALREYLTKDLPLEPA